MSPSPTGIIHEGSKLSEYKEPYPWLPSKELKNIWYCMHFDSPVSTFGYGGRVKE